MPVLWVIWWCPASVARKRNGLEKRNPGCVNTARNQLVQCSPDTTGYLRAVKWCVESPLAPGRRAAALLALVAFGCATADRERLAEERQADVERFDAPGRSAVFNIANFSSVPDQDRNQILR
jgi:hypothetical protein